MVDILLTVFIVICIISFFVTVAQLFEGITSNKKVDIHIHNHPVKTTKIIDSYIEKGGEKYVYHEEAEDEGHK